MSDWNVPRWCLPRLRGYGVNYENPPEYKSVWMRIYRAVYPRAPSYAVELADQRAGEFFARAWSIERSRRERLQRLCHEAIESGHQGELDDVLSRMFDLVGLRDRPSEDVAGSITPSQNTTSS